MSAKFSQSLKDIQLSDMIKVECLDENLYRGQTIVMPSNRRVYGGQFLAQALNAASQTLKQNFVVHSFHCYFIRAGDPRIPIIYQVDKDHDGKSFSKRSIRGIQRGKVAFHMIASFALCGYSRGYDIQVKAMPSVPPPTSLLSIEELTIKSLSQPGLQPKLRSYLTQTVKTPFATDIRPLDGKLIFERKQNKNGVTLAWMRVKGSLGKDKLHMHICGLAYLSDVYSVTSIVVPYPNYLWFRLQLASIDHSIWVHRPFLSDEWLLGVFRTTISCSGKGLSHIEFFQNGNLVATCAQEGLAREKPKTVQPQNKGKL